MLSFSFVHLAISTFILFPVRSSSDHASNEIQLFAEHQDQLIPIEILADALVGDVMEKMTSYHELPPDFDIMYSGQILSNPLMPLADLGTHTLYTVFSTASFRS